MIVDTLSAMHLPPAPVPEVGLNYWMKRVLVRADEAASDFSSGAVHGLRTALRRCRSMAEGLRVFDSDPGWKKMRRAGKELFTSLGALRDTHVMMEWVENLSHSGDPIRERLLNLLQEQERVQKKAAAAALETFDRKQWEKWAEELPARATRIPLDSRVFAHLALERWQRAHSLHAQALRNRSARAFHELRIGIKQLRYTVENFLPTLHALWGNDLKNLQDILGEVHDLDVVWQTATAARVFPDAPTRASWHARIVQERNRRISQYRQKMVGEGALWARWREELPADEDLRSLAFERLHIWASLMDPEFAHARHVAGLSKQLYDRLPLNGIIRRSSRENYGEILFSAALVHDAGRSRSNRGHHKISARLVRKVPPPLGMPLAALSLMALVSRYHRGALPRATQGRFAALPDSKKRLVQLLAGILRFACACDREHDGQIRKFDVDSSTPIWTLRAEGYDPATPLAEHLAAARHLLEIACQRPILIVPAEIGSHIAA